MVCIVCRCCFLPRHLQENSLSEPASNLATARDSGNRLRSSLGLAAFPLLCARLSAGNDPCLAVFETRCVPCVASFDRDPPRQSPPFTLLLLFETDVNRCRSRRLAYARKVKKDGLEGVFSLLGKRLCRRCWLERKAHALARILNAQDRKVNAFSRKAHASARILNAL